MSTKNPFEIRTEILAMAKDYMDQQYRVNLEFAQQAFEEAVRAGKTVADSWATFAPKMYSVDELVAKAQELYGFVSHK